MRRPATPDTPPGTVRRTLVVAFLLAFLVTGAADVEAWPLSGWKLFSRLRTGAPPAWAAVMVDHEGHERAVPFAELPRGYRGALHLLPEFGRPTPPLGVCKTWLTAVRREAYDATAIRIYRDPSRRRRLVHQCEGSAP
ncbi:MAG TPA: hypothetical protein VM030_10700 [Acidimicrobiales bacterium]|nr:hypothetical protein [Acidimicrobiales bacterium]